MRTAFQLPWSNVTRPPGDYAYINNQLMLKRGPPIPEELEAQTEACEFIERCLTVDLDERPSARELLDHSYPRVRTGT